MANPLIDRVTQIFTRVRGGSQMAQRPQLTGGGVKLPTVSEQFKPEDEGRVATPMEQLKTVDKEIAELSGTRGPEGSPDRLEQLLKGFEAQSEAVLTAGAKPFKTVLENIKELGQDVGQLALEARKPGPSGIVSGALESISPDTPQGRERLKEISPAFLGLTAPLKMMGPAPQGKIVNPKLAKSIVDDAVKQLEGLKSRPDLARPEAVKALQGVNTNNLQSFDDLLIRMQRATQGMDPTVKSAVNNHFFARFNLYKQNPLILEQSVQKIFGGGVFTQAGEAGRALGGPVAAIGGGVAAGIAGALAALKKFKPEELKQKFEAAKQQAGDSFTEFGKKVDSFFGKTFKDLDNNQIEEIKKRVEESAPGVVVDEYFDYKRFRNNAIEVMKQKALEDTLKKNPNFDTEKFGADTQIKFVAEQEFEKRGFKDPAEVYFALRQDVIRKEQERLGPFNMKELGAEEYIDSVTMERFAKNGFNDPVLQRLKRSTSTQ